MSQPGPRPINTMALKVCLNWVVGAHHPCTIVRTQGLGLTRSVINSKERVQ